MGNHCTGQKNLRKDKGVALNQAFKLTQVTQGELHFNLQLNNIKVKIPEIRSLKVVFILHNFGTYESSLSQDNQGKHSFKPNFECQLTSTERDLLSQNLEIWIKDQNNEVISQIQIIFYEIATGPQHFDYEIQVRQKNQRIEGKISFDIKMAQVLQIHLQCGKLVCDMNENLMQQTYQYSMKLVTHTHTFLSDYSDIFVNPAFIDTRNEEVEEDNESITKLKRMHTVSQKNLKFGRQSTLFYNDHKKAGVNFKKLIWEEQAGVDLDIEVPLNYIPASSLQLCIWAVKADEREEVFQDRGDRKKTQLIKIAKVANNKDEDSSIDEDRILVCETYISLNQIFKHEFDDNFEIKDGIKVYNYSCEVDKGLWYNGQQEGTVHVVIKMRVPAYLQQLIVGVKTNKCIQQGSSVINSINAGQISVKEIQKLAQCCRKLTEVVFKLQAENQNSHLMRMNLRAELNLNVANIIEILKKTHKESIKCFYYKNQSELFNAQKILLELGDHLITTADDLDDSNREQYYLMLKLIMDRGELALNQMGFTEQTEKTIQKLYSIKLQVGQEYQKFLYTALNIVLQKLEQKAYSENERIFIENFIARAYFQIPEFRNTIAQCVIHPDDPPLVEWRGTEFKLEEEQTAYQNKELIDLFDWDLHFYSYLDQQEKGQQNKSMLKECLAQSEWQKRIGKRGLAFFMFLQEWCAHVNSNVVIKDHIPWHDIPGYRSLLKGFLLEIKQRQITHFPDAMKQTILAILNNETLLNIIIVLLFNKTNLYESESVIETFKIINSALQYIMKLKKKFPTQVDLIFFFKGIKMVLQQSEHAFSICKCIWMLYNNYTIFPLSFRKDLCDLLFPQLAPKLFMHWSHNVRLIFHHFLLYRVQHLHRTDTQLNQDEEELLKQYQKETRPKKQQSFLDSNKRQNQIIDGVIAVKYYKFIQTMEEAKQMCKEQSEDQLMEERNFHKAMRQKLLQKKREQRNKQQKLEDSQEHESRSSSSFSSSYLILDDDELMNEPLNDIKKQPTNDNTLQVTENPEAKFRPPIRKEPQTVIQKTCLKYHLRAFMEFEDMRLRYKKWNDQHMKSQICNKTLDYEQFEVPVVNLHVPCDERESNIPNQDDW